MCGLRTRYSTDLSDPEWEILCPLVPAVRPGGRPARHSRREILNALAYWLRAGCA
ncbi:transposase [Streptomyces sp. 900105755]